MKRVKVWITSFDFYGNKLVNFEENIKTKKKTETEPFYLKNRKAETEKTETERFAILKNRSFRFGVQF